MAPKKKSRRSLYIALVVVVVIVFGAVLVVHGKGTTIDPAQIGRVTRGDVARSVVATGKVEPITKVEVKSKASGIVTSLATDINEQVHRGQVLAQLDQQEILDQVAAQKATLAAADSNANAATAAIVLDRVNAEAPGPADVCAIRRNGRGRCRRRAWFRRRLTTMRTRNTWRRRTCATGRSRRLRWIPAKLHQAQAQVQQAQASLRQLEEELAYTTITSPMDGVVLSRDVEKGDAVSSILVLGSTATLVMTVGDTHQVYVQGKVDEADIGKVYLGQPARIKVESFREKMFLGKVTRIAPLGVEKDNVTTFEVRVSIDNPGGELKANMTANAEILLDEHHNVLTVPEQAVKFDKDKRATVQVPDAKGKDGKREVAITTGLSDGSRMEVLSGLKENDQVVLQQQ